MTCPNGCNKTKFINILSSLQHRINNSIMITKDEHVISLIKEVNNSLNDCKIIKPIDTIPTRPSINAICTYIAHKYYCCNLCENDYSDFDKILCACSKLCDYLIATYDNIAGDYTLTRDGKQIYIFDPELTRLSLLLRHNSNVVYVILKRKYLIQ